MRSSSWTAAQHKFNFNELEVDWWQSGIFARATCLLTAYVHSFVRIFDVNILGCCFIFNCKIKKMHRFQTLRYSIYFPLINAVVKSNVAFFTLPFCWQFVCVKNQDINSSFMWTQIDRNFLKIGSYSKC